NLPASCNRTTQTGYFLVHNSSLPVRLLLLGFFENDALVSVTHTLALVGLRPAVSADFRSHLSNDLFVGTLDDDFRLARTFSLHASGQRVHDVVGETKLQFQRVALDLGTKAHADQIKAAFEALADTGDHVVDQRAKRAGHCLGLTGIIGNGKGDL